MGIPKFFRWLCERYPCLCDSLKEYQIPEFDNLYLDMNGIIHVCSHPDGCDPHFRITEEQIFASIFHYIEVLFRLIQPKKLFLMAVDGVAPRAKMNQQRSRRFSSAKDVERSEKKAIEKGEILPTEKKFDSNCITPGTPFMARLHEQLKYFVSKKISTDRLWQRPTIILSGHLVPGEGEHKIMDYIRYLRSQPDWDPNTKHCLYGLDADLIILGMCTHELNVTLLREEVTFGKNSKRQSTPETTNYQLLYLSLLKDYLDLEFQGLKEKLTFPFDINKIIDDWVLMGFLMGNDFIPHLPHLHIANNGLSIIYDTYQAVLPTLDGYINEAGILNLSRFEKFLQKLSQFDFDHFNDTYADMKYFEAKTGRSMTEDFATKIGTQGKQDDGLKELIDSSNLEMFDFGEDEVMEDLLEENGFDTNDAYQGTFHKEFSLHKKDYYMNKMEYPSVSTQQLKKEAEGYVIALQWILHYYYRGCPSWGWYYPHHYSPYISDLHSFSSLDIQFELGKPFQPFQQLLAVLPAASKEFLPLAFQQLMTSESSPIIDYYPPDFEVDLNGKKQQWEAVVLIPFIEEKRLLDAMAPHYGSLTDDEIRRNSHGPMLVYNYTPESLGVYHAPDYFPVISHNHAKAVEMLSDEVALPVEKIVCGLHPNAKPNNIYRHGFPTLNRIPFKGHLDKKGVKVFEHISRGENMILEIQERDNLREEVVNALLNRKDIFIYWPHLQPAKIEKIVTSEFVVKAGSSPGSSSTGSSPLPKVMTPVTSGEAAEWGQNCTTLRLNQLNRYGIELGKLDTIVWVWPLQGTKVKFDSNGQPCVEMVWSKHAVYCPLNTVVLDVGKDDSGVKFNCLKDYFEPDTRVFQLGHLYYGYQAKVLGIEKSAVKIELTHTTEPILKEVMQDIAENRREYFPGYVSANMLGISSFLLSRITGTVLVQSPHTDVDRMNIGLSLKFNKTNQECVGYTKREGTTWFYSQQALDMVRTYMDKFPELFEYLSTHTNEDIFFKDKIFTDEETRSEKWNEVKLWLKTLEKGEKRTVGGELLEPSAIARLEQTISAYEEIPLKLVTIKLKPIHLYVPKPHIDMTCPDPDAEFRKLDRVVYVRECHSIPIGTKGIIVGIEKKKTGENPNDDSAWLYDVFFDCEVIGGFALQGSTKKNCYRLTKHVLINISHGLRVQKPNIVNSSKPVNLNHLSKQLKKSVEMSMPSFSREPSAPSDTSGSVSNFFKQYNQKTGDGGGGGMRGPPQQPAVLPLGGGSNVHRPVASLMSMGGGMGGVGGGPLPPPPRNILQRPPQPQPPVVNNKDFSLVWNMLKRNSGSGGNNIGATDDGNVIKSQIFTPSKPQFVDRSPQDVNPIINEQTEALKKILRLGPDLNNPAQIPTATVNRNTSAGSSSSLTFEKRSCGHASCCAELMALCQSRGIPYPAYSFHPDLNGRVTCKLTFYDGTQIVGTNSPDNSRASASAACTAIDSLKNFNLNTKMPTALFPTRSGVNEVTTTPAATNWRSGQRFVNNQPTGIVGSNAAQTLPGQLATEENNLLLQPQMMMAGGGGVRCQIPPQPQSLPRPHHQQPQHHQPPPFLQNFISSAQMAAPKAAAATAPTTTHLQEIKSENQRVVEPSASRNPSQHLKKGRQRPKIAARFQTPLNK